MDTLTRPNCFAHSKLNTIDVEQPNYIELCISLVTVSNCSLGRVLSYHCSLSTNSQQNSADTFTADDPFLLRIMRVSKCNCEISKFIQMIPEYLFLSGRCLCFFIFNNNATIHTHTIVSVARESVSVVRA